MMVLSVLHKKKYMVKTDDVCREGVGRARKGQQEVRSPEKQEKHSVCAII